MIILIAYDIIDTRKRNHIVKILLSYGTRVQKSVFECDLDEKRHNDIYSKLFNVMQTNFNKLDSIRIYKICEKCLSKTQVIGLGKIEKTEPFLIF